MALPLQISALERGQTALRVERQLAPLLAKVIGIERCRVA